MLKRRPKYRPSLDRLEDRTVMSVDLTAIGSAVNASYATFATTVRTAEATLATQGGPPGTTTTTTTTVTGASVAATVEGAIVTLEQSLAVDLATVPALDSLVFDQLDANGLGGQMDSLFSAADAGTPDGSVLPPDLLSLYTAVDAQIAASLQQTSVDAYFAAILPPAGVAGTGAVSTIAAPTGSSVATQIEYGIVALEQTLGSDLTATPTASSVIFQQLDATGLGSSLATMISTAEAGATTDSVNSQDLGLLDASVDAQIATSFQQTSSDVYLDVSGQGGGSSTLLATLDAEVDAAYATFATLVRTAEGTITATTGMGFGPGGGTGTGPGGGTTTTTPGLTASGGTAVVGTTGTATLTFTVTLSAASTTAVTVDYATADGTAIAGTDYTAASGTLTFPAGTTSETVTVTVDGETTTDSDKTFTLNLTNASTGATITSNSATGDILYSTATPTLTVPATSTSVDTSGTGSLTFTVSLSAVSANTVTVNYTTTDGTAVAGTDYTATSGTLTFAPGTTSQTVAVTVAGETSTTATKTVNLNLTGATGTTNATATAVGTINYIVAGQPNDLSDNLSDTSDGIETATGTTDVAASFTTGGVAFTLNSLTLLLDQSSAGTATVAIYTDGGLQPGTLVGTLTSPTTYTTALSNTTFTSSAGIALSASTTYWVVLTAPSGSYDWSFTADDSGSGLGFTDTWAESSDGGTTWFAYDSSPTQFSVTATAG